MPTIYIVYGCFSRSNCGTSKSFALRQRVELQKNAFAFAVGRSRVDELTVPLLCSVCTSSTEHHSVSLMRRTRLIRNI